MTTTTDTEPTVIAIKQLERCALCNNVYTVTQLPEHQREFTGITLSYVCIRCTPAIEAEEAAFEEMFTS